MYNTGEKFSSSKFPNPDQRAADLKYFSTKLKIRLSYFSSIQRPDTAGKIIPQPNS